MYLKFINAIKFESSKNVMLHMQPYAMMIFIALCNNDAFSHEITWLDEVQQKQLSRLNLHFPKCMKFLTILSSMSWKPWRNLKHAT